MTARLCRAQPLRSPLSTCGISTWIGTATQPLTLVQQLPITVPVYIPGLLPLRQFSLHNELRPRESEQWFRNSRFCGRPFYASLCLPGILAAMKSFLVSHTIQTGPGPVWLHPCRLPDRHSLVSADRQTAAVRLRFPNRATINPGCIAFTASCQHRPGPLWERCGGLTAYPTHSPILGSIFSYWNLTESAATAPTEVCDL